MKCIGCGVKINLENSGSILNRELPTLCVSCKRECLFAELIESPFRRNYEI